MRKAFVITTLVAAAAAIPFLGAGAAIGQIAAPVPAMALPVAALPAGWLGLGEIATRLGAEGWTVLKIEAEPDDGNYEACLVGADGRAIEARIDPLTAAILSQKADDCHDDDSGSRSD
ncbi:MAG: PepSY domain-containing protein [Bauldia sp.]|nr:PepSY domain-containing protein [Bauldia sp.]